MMANRTAALVTFLALGLLGGCVERTVYVRENSGATAAAPTSNAGGGMGYGAAPPAYDVQNVNGFYDALSPYGRWYPHTVYGQVWVPSRSYVQTGWRPYTHGHWEYSEWGWTWVSYHPFGWATSHYGRWYYDSSLGWVWVPGTRWSPAWVTWRTGGGYVGWAPMPPGSYYGGTYAVYETSWVFVSSSAMGTTTISTVIVRNGGTYQQCMRRTRWNRTTVTVHGDPIYRGPDPRDVEQAGATIRHRPIRDIDDDHPTSRPPRGVTIAGGSRGGGDHDGADRGGRPTGNTTAGNNGTGGSHDGTTRPGRDDGRDGRGTTRPGNDPADSRTGRGDVTNPHTGRDPGRGTTRPTDDDRSGREPVIDLTDRARRDNGVVHDRRDPADDNRRPDPRDDRNTRDPRRDRDDGRGNGNPASGDDRPGRGVPADVRDGLPDEDYFEGGRDDRTPSRPTEAAPDNGIGQRYHPDLSPPRVDNRMPVDTTTPPGVDRPAAPHHQAPARPNQAQPGNQFRTAPGSATPSYRPPSGPSRTPTYQSPGAPSRAPSYQAPSGPSRVGPTPRNTPSRTPAYQSPSAPSRAAPTPRNTPSRAAPTPRNTPSRAAPAPAPAPAPKRSAPRKSRSSKKKARDNPRR